MRTRIALVLSFLAIASLAAPVTGQDGFTAPPVTTIPNDAYCVLMGQDVASCEAVLTGLAGARIVPEAFAALIPTWPVLPFTLPLPLPLPLTGPSIEGEVGDTLSRGDARVKLERLNWSPLLSDSLPGPAAGNRFVSALVRYRALADGARYNVFDWVATDETGARYPVRALSAKEPALLIGVLPAGGVVRGWVTFEVPTAMTELRLMESQVGLPGLAWSMRR
jgi:hypothetical protein